MSLRPQSLNLRHFKSGPLCWPIPWPVPWPIPSPILLADPWPGEARERYLLRVPRPCVQVRYQGGDPK